ncbi:MAG: porin [Flavobacteriales bacterium]
MSTLTRLKAFAISGATILCFAVAHSQTTTPQVNIQQDLTSKKWYDNINLRGYAQFRYNRLLETNDSLGCEQCDRSWGGDGGFFIRRMRLIFFGQINPRVYFYIQPDLASSPSSDRLHFAQIRDAYLDVGIDSKSTFRFRIGQSKVPYGFENMQSSQNRLPLDRADALNSAVANERDLGVFFYWAPQKKRELLSNLVKSGLKGSGDYGIIAIGAYNGQTANSPELNDEPHVVGRITYPFEIGQQVIEIGVQGYKGRFVLPKSNVSSGVKTNENMSYLDTRLAGSFTLYPKPFGILAEYNIGKGPEYNVETDSIAEQNLSGGFVTMSYAATLGNHKLFPFVRYQVYDGGKKHEKDARSYVLNEWEFGAEWSPFSQFELTAMYTISDRSYIDSALPFNHQKGQLLRIQAQLNF